MIKYQFESGNTKLDVVRRAPPRGANGKVFIEKTQKQSNEVT